MSILDAIRPLSSPGFVTRRGKDGNYVTGHPRWTSGPGAAAARWLIVLWLMQNWSKELRIVDICISWSHRLHNTRIGCQIYSKVKLKWNCWKSRRGHVPRCPIAGDATEYDQQKSNSDLGHNEWVLGNLEEAGNRRSTHHQLFYWISAGICTSFVWFCLLLYSSS